MPDIIKRLINRVHEWLAWLVSTEDYVPQPGGDEEVPP